MLELHDLLPGARHFYVYEACCKCGCGFGRNPGDVSPALVELLEDIREDTGRPLIPTSICRCERRNEAEGGVEASVHTLGEGADLTAVGGARKHAIQKAAYAHGAMGVGTGETFVHVDVHDGRVKPRPSAWGY